MIQYLIYIIKIDGLELRGNYFLNNKFQIGLFDYREGK